MNPIKTTHDLLNFTIKMALCIEKEDPDSSGHKLKVSPNKKKHLMFLNVAPN